MITIDIFLSKHKKLVAIPFILVGLVIILSFSIATYMKYSISSFRVSDSHNPPATEVLLIFNEDLDLAEPPHIYTQYHAQLASAWHKEKLIQKIILSGKFSPDDTTPNVWRNLLTYSVPTKDMFLDRESADMYESVYRAKQVYGAKSIIVIGKPQAAYIGNKLGVPTYVYDRNFRLSERYDKSESVFVIGKAIVENLIDFYRITFHDVPNTSNKKVNLSEDGQKSWGN